MFSGHVFFFRAAAHHNLQRAPLPRKYSSLPLNSLLFLCRRIGATTVIDHDALDFDLCSKADGAQCLFFNVS